MVVPVLSVVLMNTSEAKETMKTALQVIKVVTQLPPKLQTSKPSSLSASSSKVEPAVKQASSQLVLS